MLSFLTSKVWQLPMFENIFNVLFRTNENIRYVNTSWFSLMFWTASKYTALTLVLQHLQEHRNVRAILIVCFTCTNSKRSNIQLYPFVNKPEIVQLLVNVVIKLFQWDDLGLGFFFALPNLVRVENLSASD